MATIEKILSRFDRPADGCWIWTGASSKGYGYVQFEGKMTTVHRAMYRQFKGPIPEGLQIDHLCRNKLCGNPGHLEIVTGKENTRRASTAISTINAAKTHCHQGHPLSGENLRVSNGHRRCRACLAQWARRKRAPHLLSAEERVRRHKAGTRRGEKHPAAKLNTAQIIAIRAAAMNGETPPALASAYGVTPTNIRYILRGKAWTHVEEDSAP